MRQKPIIYAYITCSPSDEGYYVSIFGHNGKDITTSDVFTERMDARDWIDEHYPEANIQYSSLKYPPGEPKRK